MTAEQQIKILIVDDTPEIINQLQQILTTEGYETFVATTGEKAMQRIELNRPDLILLDIIMPGIDGYETCTQIKSDIRYMNIPVVFMSALLETFDKIKAFRIGAVDYITKPINTEELLIRIKTHISINKLQKELLEANNKLEEKVQIRTNELQESQRNLLIKNEEYEAINEELIQTNEELRILNNVLIISKQTAEAKEELLRNITDNIPANISVVDIKTLKYTFINKLYTQNFNKPYEEIINHHISEIIGEENTEFAMKYIEEVRQGKFSSYINIFNLAQGKRYINVNYVPGYDSTGNLKEIIVVSFDVTQIKESEIKLENAKKKLEISQFDLIEKNSEYEALNEELRQSNEDLYKAKEKAEESNKLKTAFLQNMSHEIRTPMNAIVGFADLLNNSDLSTEKHKSFISIIINSSNQLLSIVSDILTISSIDTKQEKLYIESVKINEIIVELLAIFKNQASNQNIAIYSKQQLSDNESEIMTDRTKITQILTNLLTNSLKFTHEGFVEFGYKIINTPETDLIQFFVKDTGIGIETDQHEKIFERFRQADITINKKYGGTGLGLSISKGFAELLGGKIWVESEPGNGATFYFTIPYKPVNILKDIEIFPKALKNEALILVAEDQEFNYLLIEETLLEMNYKIIHAKNGKEAIEMCKTNPTISLILMDIKMPEINGFDAAKQIKEFRPNLPIIAQSAYALEHEKNKYNDNTFVEYITKPIIIEELKQLILKYIN